MSKASDVLKMLEAFHSVGDVDAAEIVSELESKLASLGYEEVEVEAVIDDSEGIFVRFSDPENDDVIILFTYDEDGDPIAMVVSDDDDQILINLAPLDPPQLELGDDVFIDMMDLSWITKSTINLLLQAGNVGPNVRESIHVVMGKTKMRLPLVIKKSEMSDLEKRRTRKAKDIGFL